MKRRDQFKVDQNQEEDLDEVEEKDDSEFEVKMFGISFSTLISIVTFFLLSSVVAMFMVVEGWEMQKLVLQ